MGRHARYDFTDKDFLATIEGLIRDGWDNKQVAEYLKYNETYFSKLTVKYPQLGEAIIRARKPITFAIENSLIKKCMGMKVKSVTKRWLTGPDGKQTDIEIIQETETELPPDGRLIQFYLSQRKPEVYNKQPQKIDVTTDGNPFLSLIQKASESNGSGTEEPDKGSDNK